MVVYGVGSAGHPYYRFGDGDQPLVLIPGVMDPLGWNETSRLAGELLARYYFRALQEYDVWVLSRPPGLASGVTVEEIASRYSRALEEIGNAHVLGFSFGGFIAAQIGAKRPELVGRLVLTASAHRYGEDGRQTLERWKELGKEWRWTKIHREYARTVYSGYRGWLVPSLYRLGERWLPTPVVAEDVPRTLAAACEFEGRDVLAEIEAPTLVVSGRRDVLVPETVCREAAREVPDGYITTLSGGHAVYEECRSQFSAAVRSFLD